MFKKLSKEDVKDIILCVTILLLCAWCFKLKADSEKKIENLEISYKEEGKQIQFAYDQSLSKLKETNKALYDSIKKYKDIEYVVDIKYVKEYIHDTVFIEKRDTTIHKEIQTFAYKNENKNDSINYNLLIGSVTEPSWYKLDVTVGDEFIIYNRKNDNFNQTVIDSKYGDVEATVINTKDKKKLKDRFVIGLSIRRWI